MSSNLTTTIIESVDLPAKLVRLINSDSAPCHPEHFFDCGV